MKNVNTKKKITDSKRFTSFYAENDGELPYCFDLCHDIKSYGQLWYTIRESCNKDLKRLMFDYNITNEDFNQLIFTKEFKEDYSWLFEKDTKNILEPIPEMTLDKAIALAATLFEGKFDKSGEPYILHCLQVMYNNMKHNDLQLSIASVLHDVVEDTKLTFEDLIYLGVSERAINMLRHVTRTKGQSYQEEIDKISTDLDSTRLKMGDLEHNSMIFRLKGVEAKDLERIAKYHKAYYQLKNALVILEQQACCDRQA